MSHNQDLVKILNRLVLGGKIKLVQKRFACHFNVIYFVVDLEHTHLTGARIRRIFVEEECLFMSTKKVSVILIVVLQDPTGFSRYFTPS